MNKESLTIDTKKLEKADSVAVSNESKNLSQFKEIISNSGQLKILQGLITTDKNEEIKDKASNFMTTIGNVLRINVPILWSIGELFETKRPVDILGKKEERKNNKFLNAVLKMFGYKNGIDSLHESYISEQLKWVDMGFAKDAFSEYQKLPNKEIQDNEKTRNICGLENIFKNTKSKIKETIKAKIPENYENLKTTITKQIQKNPEKLSINTINMIDPSLIITDKNNKESIDIEKLQKNTETFADAYLKTTILKFAKSEDDFINSENVDVHSCALAIFGNLTGDKFFVEWVNLGLISAASIWGETKINKTEIDPNQAAKIKSELNKVKNSPLTAEMIINTSKTHNVPINYLMAIMKNDSTYWTAGKWSKTHNPGNVGNTDNGSTKDRGTREAWVDAVGKNIARRISEYQKIYGSKIPSIKELSQNQWPDGKWFLSNQWNYKKPNPDSIGAYMTSKEGQDRVQNLAQNLRQGGISDEMAA